MGCTGSGNGRSPFPLLSFLCEPQHVIAEMIREPEEYVDFDAALGEGNSTSAGAKKSHLTLSPFLYKEQCLLEGGQQILYPRALPGGKSKSMLPPGRDRNT